MAWQALEKHFTADLLCYSKETANGDHSQSGSRIRTVLEALSRKDHPEILLVWQIGLLKLLPFLRRNTAAKTVLFLHGIEAWKEQDWMTRRLATRVDLFLTNSDYTWKRFCELNPSLASAKHQTVPLGLASTADDEIPTPRNQPVALMLSRVSKSEDYKGHREVIDAWPLVLEQKSDAQLWIAGDGDQRHELEQLVKTRGLDPGIKFFGKVSEEKKHELLKTCRCFVMPSRGEGFGLVYLEAMRLGRPCLVSTIDAGREVVSPPEAGLAANPDDREELAGALVRLLSSGLEWEQWSNQARHRYEANYTATHFQKRLLAALFPDDLSTDSGDSQLRPETNDRRPLTARYTP